MLSVVRGTTLEAVKSPLLWYITMYVAFLNLWKERSIITIVEWAIEIDLGDNSEKTKVIE